MYRLIVTDYDGTLVPEGKTLSQELYVKLNKLNARGVTFAVASGRTYDQLRKLLFQCSQNTVFVANDGAQVMYRNCVLYKKTVCVHIAKAVCSVAMRDGMSAVCALREENKGVKEEHLSLPFFLSTDIFKIIIIKNGKDPVNVKAEAEKRGLRVCYEDDTYLEFCNKDANNGEAVKKLMQKFSVMPNELVCMGDGENDLSMMTLTQNRVIPANACEKVRALGGTNVEDVEKYLLDI